MSIEWEVMIDYCCGSTEGETSIGVISLAHLVERTGNANNVDSDVVPVHVQGGERGKQRKFMLL